MNIRFGTFLAAALLLFSACGPATPAPTPLPLAATPTVQSAAPAATPVAMAPAAIVISDAWTRRSTIAMPPMAVTPGTMPAIGATPSGMPAMGPTPAAVLPNNAVYMLIKNTTAAPDKLVKAEFEFATAELHTVEMKDGVMDMHPVPGVDVPANGQVELKSGSFHIMLIGMKKDFAVGDKLSLKLTFANAGTINVQADVRAQ